MENSDGTNNIKKGLNPFLSQHAIQHAIQHEIQHAIQQQSNNTLFKPFIFLLTIQ